MNCKEFATRDFQAAVTAEEWSISHCQYFHQDCVNVLYL